MGADNYSQTLLEEIDTKSRQGEDVCELGGRFCWENGIESTGSYYNILILMARL